MPSFDFDAARRERLAGHDPIAFRLGGEDFVALPAIPFALVVDHLELSFRTELEAFEMAVSFVRSCLPEDDHGRFERALRNPEEPVTDDEPMAILAYLMGCYVGRPTAPPADSSDGRDGTGEDSKTKPKLASATRGQRQRGASSTGSKVA